MSCTWLVTRLGVDRAAVGHGLLGLGPQEDVLAPFDQDARFGFVARRDAD